MAKMGRKYKRLPGHQNLWKKIHAFYTTGKSLQLMQGLVIFNLHKVLTNRSLSSNHRLFLEAGTRVAKVIAERGLKWKMTQSMKIVSDQRNSLSHFCLIVCKSAEECVPYLKTFSSKIFFLSLGFKRKNFMFQSYLKNKNEVETKTNKSVSKCYKVLLSWDLENFYFLHFT